MTRSRRALALASTLALAAGGGAVFAALGLPVGWLLGSALAVSVASLLGHDTRLPNWLRDAVFIVLGTQAGAGVTPAVVGQLALWPLSFAIQMAGVVAVIAVTYTFLRKGFGWDKETALFAALPGAMSFVIAAASQTRADMTRITVVQSVRLLLLIGALTPTLAWLEGGEGIRAADRGDAGSPAEYAILVVACLAGAFLGHVSRLPGGILLGALAASAVLHVTEIAPVAMPSAISVAGLLVLGALIGSRLKGENRRALVELLPASLGAFVIGLAISAAAGLAAFWWLGIGFGKIALAYAPGALEALTVLAYQFDLDPAYVAAHHVVRFVCIALLVPILARRLPKAG
ncbi:AbrB family transcriptional regulator [Aureimonas sp. SA4125]|uniref:AbrB family transcriptional regulator n=1 Tax=Aureimonas sp. SA4125 TaxID=2826993 RepID=UPI001CC3EC8F|nr:AbrB family transcriptional regulator [Aureimonas sp. SA4125]